LEAIETYIIHLPNVKESVITATNLQKQLTDFNMPSTLFNGIYGPDGVALLQKENRQVHPIGFKGTRVDNKSKEKMKSPGLIGCFYSHFLLWKKCAELDKPIIIMEDDNVLTRPFIPVEWQDVLILVLGHPAKSRYFQHLLKNPTGNPRAIYYNRSSMPGACGYALKPCGAKKLVETYKNTYLPADNCINKLIVSIQIHNYIMGRALVAEDGKVSLTRIGYWR